MRTGFSWHYTGFCDMSWCR